MSVLPAICAPLATASIRGSLLVPANRDLGAVRLWLHDGSGKSRPIAIEGGAFHVEGLAPGRYRLELRGPRLVFARRVELAVGDAIALDFTVR